MSKLSSKKMSEYHFRFVFVCEREIGNSRGLSFEKKGVKTASFSLCCHTLFYFVVSVCLCLLITPSLFTFTPFMALLIALVFLGSHPPFIFTSFSYFYSLHPIVYKPAPSLHFVFFFK